MNLYDIDVRAIDGTVRSMGAYRGRTLLIVNVASRCGYTPQYAGLQALYARHVDRGLVILGFPCNQFGRQEPGPDADIDQFCKGNYAVTFPMFARINVNGRDTHPLFRLLKHERRGIFGLTTITWNFNKFLVNAEGAVLRRYGSAIPPARIEADIVPLLA